MHIGNIDIVGTLSEDGPSELSWDPNPIWPALSTLGHNLVNVFSSLNFHPIKTQKYLFRLKCMIKVYIDQLL